jgi:hypothetical protein
MQPVQWEHRPEGLRAPALVCAFKGWNDAADAASSAVEFVGTSLGALLADVPHTRAIPRRHALRDDRPGGVL